MKHKFRISISLKAVILVLVVFLFAEKGLTQNRNIDSLKSLLSSKFNHERVDILVELARTYSISDKRLTLQYASQAFDIAIQLGDSLRIVKTGRIKSQSLRAVSQIDSSLMLYDGILRIAKRHDFIDEIKAILNGLGIGHAYKANFDKALEYHFKSLELRRDGGDKFEISVALNNIGLVYSELEDYDQALFYYTQALQVKREINNKYDLDILLLNTSLCYAYNERFTEATRFVEEALSMCNRRCSEETLVISNHIYGIIFFGQQKFSEAQKYFLESYGLSKSIGIEQFHLDNIVYLLRIYIHRNQLQLASEYLKEAELLIASGLPYNNEIIKIYAQLFSLYTKSADFEKVAFYQNKYITLKDSIYNKELTTNLMKIEAEHLEKENKAKIEFQNRILALNDQVITGQKVANVSVGVVAFLVIILAMLLAKNNRQKNLRIVY